MHIPSIAEVNTLMQASSGPCISLFMPIYHVGDEIQHNPLRYKRLLKEAEQHVLLQQLSSHQREALLKPLLKQMADPSLWQQAGEGLAIFRSPDLYRSYHLPIQLKEKMIIANHFSLKQILPLLTNDGHFYILALSHNDVRLLEGTRFTIQEIPLPADVPQNVAATLRYPRPESQLQYHSSTTAMPGGKGERPAAIFHGQGGEADLDKENLLRFFQHIDRGMHSFLSNKKIPLLLAGVEYLLPLYHQTNTYPYLLQSKLSGNPDKLEPATLQKQAWNVVEPHILQDQQEAIITYREFADTERAAHNLNEITPAADNGRVDTLFVTSDTEQWGTYDKQTSTVSLHYQAQPGDEDLLERAITQTYLHDGMVYILAQDTMPTDQPIAALLRY